MENYSSENLDDGELWLPSDIFPVEEPLPCNNNNKFKNNNPITSSFCYCYSCRLHHHHHHRRRNEQEEAADESIIQRFAALSLVQQHQQAHNTHSFPKPFPFTTQRRFRPAERCCSCTDCSLSEYFELNGGGRELLRTDPPPVYPNQLYIPPVQHQVEGLMEARTRFLQMQEQNRLVRMQRRNPGLDRFNGNRVLPFGINGESSSVRDYGGTGVFLPRIPTNNIDNNGGKRPGLIYEAGTLNMMKENVFLVYHPMPGGRNRQRCSAKWSEVSMHMN